MADRCIENPAQRLHEPAERASALECLHADHERGSDQDTADLRSAQADGFMRLRRLRRRGEPPRIRLVRGFCQEDDEELVRLRLPLSQGRVVPKC